MRYPAVCLAFVVVWSVIWGIEPRYRSVWLSENVLTAIMIPLMIYIHRRIGLSNLAYTMVALFTAVHIVGSHYSYGEVPLGDWAKDAFGYTRNHYDRLVHFFFGFCLAIPLRELFTRGLKIRHLGAGCWTTLAVVMAGSSFYELLEWWFMLGLDPDAGISFLGAQGDVWDAQKDTALASLGGVITLLAVYLVARRDRRRSDRRPPSSGA